jgi:hypothetical protein
LKFGGLPNIRRTGTGPVAFRGTATEAWIVTEIAGSLCRMYFETAIGCILERFALIIRQVFIA